MSGAFSVVERFTSVQGEGYLSGTPAHFLRLAGCNALAQHLTCADWCDTGYSWGGGCQHEMVDFDAIHNTFHASNAPLLVITGGEPMLQGEAIDRYLTKYPEPRWGRTIAVETNGTLPRERHDVWYTVSPKPPFYEVAPGPVSEVKLVSRTLSFSEGRSIHFVAPFRHLTKTQLVALYLRKHSGWADRELLRATTSCYDPTVDRAEYAGCGRCMACFRRWVALSNNGITETYREAPWEWPGDRSNWQGWLDNVRRTYIMEWPGIVRNNLDALRALERVRHRQ